MNTTKSALFQRQTRSNNNQVEMDPMFGIRCSHSIHRRIREVFRRPKKFSSCMKITSDMKERIGSLHRKKSGQRCIIVGSAPSITKVDLSSVHGCDVFALNRAADICASIVNCEKSLIIADHRVMNDYGKNLPFQLFDNLFLSTRISGIIHQNIYYFDLYKKPQIYKGYAEDDLRKPLYTCYTVAAVAMQVSVAMGYSQIYLAGIDLNFPDEEPHFYTSSEGERVRAQTSSKKLAPLMRAGLAYLAYWAEQKGSTVINLSPEKSLPLIESRDFETIFPSTRR